VRTDSAHNLRRMRGCATPARLPSSVPRRCHASPAARRAPRSARVAAAPSCAGAATQAQTCRRCRRPFLAAENGPTACEWHPQLFTGGELGKYTGYVPESPAYEHRMKVRASLLLATSPRLRTLTRAASAHAVDTRREGRSGAWCASGTAAARPTRLRQAACADRTPPMTTTDVAKCLWHLNLLRL